MENLLLSFEVVFPLFALMSLGYLVKRLRMLQENTVRQMNNVVFRLFLPVLLFYNIYTTDISGSFNPFLTIFAAVSVLLSFLAAFLVVVLTEKENPKRGVMIQGIFRSNFIIFGIPVTISLFGQESAGIASLLIAVIIPMFNILSVVALEIFRGGKIRPGKILKGVVTNPLIIATVIALLVLFSNLRLPTLLEDLIADIGGIATLLALFLLGASFTFTEAHGRIRQLVTGVLGKLVVIPLVFLTASVLAGFRDAELVVLLALFGSPTAVSSFVMAQQMDGDSELAGQMVVWGSLLSVFTMFLWIFFLKQAALI